MNLTAKTEYACLAMLELAQHHATGEPVQLRVIAERHGIPAQFLVQILQQLKRAGLVHSTRGACGGYQLAESPQEVTLADLFDVVEGASESFTSTAQASLLAPVLMEVCAEVTAIQRGRLESLTLADLLDRAAVEADPMWYI